MHKHNSQNQDSFGNNYFGNNYSQGFSGVYAQNPSISTNPEVTGPGLWFWGHRKSRRAQDPQSIQQFIIDVRDLIEHHPCGDCRNHGSQYLLLDPPENYVNMRNEQGQLIGMFYWFWKFHNYVNRRLGKPQVSYPDAWNMYSDSGVSVCQSGCGSSGQSVTPNVSLVGVNNMSSPGITSVGNSYNGITPRDNYFQMTNNFFQRFSLKKN